MIYPNQGHYASLYQFLFLLHSRLHQGFVNKSLVNLLNPFSPRMLYKENVGSIF